MQAWRVIGRWERSEQNEPRWTGFWIVDAISAQRYWISPRLVPAPEELGDQDIDLPTVIADNVMDAGRILNRMVKDQLGPELV